MTPPDPEHLPVTGDELVGALRAAGLRITRPRVAVCDVVAAHHREHLTASSVLDLVRDEHRLSIDRATVYRTLEALEELGILRHAHLGHGPAVYHLAEEPPHQHLVCSECGATTAIPAEDLAALLRAVTEATGFVPDLEHFAMSGRCARCSTGR